MELLTKSLSHEFIFILNAKLCFKVRNDDVPLSFLVGNLTCRCFFFFQLTVSTRKSCSFKINAS